MQQVRGLRVCGGVYHFTHVMVTDTSNTPTTHLPARSLCLLDEFGKGTLAADGIGLLAGCLTHWAAQGADHCPKVLACTHFLELAARDDVLPRYVCWNGGGWVAFGWYTCIPYTMYTRQRSHVFLCCLILMTDKPPSSTPHTTHTGLT